MEIEEVDDMGMLVDLDQEDFMTRYQKVADSMQINSDWYYISGSYKGSLNIDYSNASFSKVTTPKHLGLGRSDFYDLFLDEMSSLAGHKVHQSDYMMWIEPANQYKSLNFYIDTAASIEFSLEGISSDDIRLALRPLQRVADRRGIDSRYMTLWEINQIVFSEAIHITTWHIRDDLDEMEVHEAFGGCVMRNSIERDHNRNKKDSHSQMPINENKVIQFNKNLAQQVIAEAESLGIKKLDAEDIWSGIWQKWPDRNALMERIPLMTIMESVVKKYKAQSPYSPFNKYQIADSLDKEKQRFGDGIDEVLRLIENT